MKKPTTKPKPEKAPKPKKKPVKPVETAPESNDPKPTPGQNGQQIEPPGSPYGPPKES